MLFIVIRAIRAIRAIQCYSCVRKSQMFKFGHLKLQMISCKSGHITTYFVGM